MNQINFDHVPVSLIPTGLYVIAAKENDTMEGFLASWMIQVSFSPLMVAIAMAKERPVYPLIKATKNYSINVVGENHKDLIKPFWNGYEEDNNPFKNLNQTLSSEGNIILKDAIATLECKLVDIQSPGDHQIVIGEITNTHHHVKNERPYTHYRTSGLDY